jgi:hypothetical protein
MLNEIAAQYPNYLSKGSEVGAVPKLKRKKASGTPGDWYINIPNYSAGPPVYTFQVRPAGRDILLSADLDHDNTSKRTAYVDWDLYYTLNDLDLLYTKGEDAEFASSELQPADDQSLESLSPEQRAAFASGLIKRESMDRLVESEQILELFQSLSSEVSGHDTLLSGMLNGTLFEPDTILDSEKWVVEYAPGRSPDRAAYDSTLLAFVIKLIFEALASTAGTLFDDIVQSRECQELWLFDESIAIGGNELILHPVSEHLQQGLSETGRDHLAVDSLNIFDPLSHRFLETIYPSLSKGQLQTELKPYGTTVEKEVYSGHFLLLPKPADRSERELRASFDKI